LAGVTGTTKGGVIIKGLVGTIGKANGDGVVGVGDGDKVVGVGNGDRVVGVGDGDEIVGGLGDGNIGLIGANGEDGTTRKGVIM
jgi:hypothetical protein